ncbi:amidophosphoribosyltransferase [Acidiluteibacter ferrifornacis]|uniref:Amidophosphoribosyltransferase n=1 Tax=Acidiluteibacter ferrifornacis TaxID=2692424 RepID=A0A6N9NG06_9FLAO|nr:class II glutamine amidotransferase [Acidiluteibacter ferrifornacis]NBG64491.1 amidophosphoribosyltransferase [Acidiluteibacter ferrifornacis]
MSDSIKHECGIALVRLLKPLDYYLEKYGTATYGINKLYLLMEKQHNRGQDGAGVANIKFDMQPGERYISRHRSNSNKPIQDVFDKINGAIQEVYEKDPELLKDTDWLKKNVGFTGELFLGHLRYGTFGRNSIENCHPFLRQNNWMTRNLVVAGNFNLTNVDELFDLLVNIGQHPKEMSDTVTVLEKIGHFLDEENNKLFKEYKTLGYSNEEISSLIAKKMDVQSILKNAALDWDGGYAMAGLMGHGDAFVLRDPSGIRPAHYYQDDEVVVVTSERPAIQTAFNVPLESIKEIKPGHALIIKRDGTVSEQLVREPLEEKQCSFERIYFSRGSDADIYKERKELGRSITPEVLKSIDYDVDNSVFSFIPNTAETAFYGMVKGMEDYINQNKLKEIRALGPDATDEQLTEVLSKRARAEKIAIKDAKLRTFITQDSGRDDLVAHVYDVTYGAIAMGKDNLVVIDDSIVRGTTLKQSIFRILDRLGPKKIVIVSSAPQIRYPDCYGIDMAKLGDFIAFVAAITLLKEQGKDAIITDVYKRCKAQVNLPKEEIRNYVKEIYAPFTAEEISAKISQLLRPEGIKAEVQVIYQTIEGLHKAIPNHKGDWYFTGDYPTPGGNKVVNKSFINYIEGKNERAY